MLRIPSSQFLSHLRIGALPEAAQVTRHLDRPAVRREQREDHGLAARPDRRRFGEAEELLQFHRGGDRAVAVVDKRNGSPARHLKPFWRVAVERANDRRLERASQMHLRQRTSAIRGGADQGAQVDRAGRQTRAVAGAACPPRRAPGQTTPPPAVPPPTRPRSAPGVRSARARRSAQRSRREPRRCRDRTTVRSPERWARSQSRSIRLAIRMRLSAAGSTRGAVAAAVTATGESGRPSPRPARQPRRETRLQPRRSRGPSTAPAPDASLTRDDDRAVVWRPDPDILRESPAGSPVRSSLRPADPKERSTMRRMSRAACLTWWSAASQPSIADSKSEVVVCDRAGR